MYIMYTYVYKQCTRTNTSPLIDRHGVSFTLKRLFLFKYVNLKCTVSKQACKHSVVFAQAPPHELSKHIRTLAVFIFEDKELVIWGERVRPDSELLPPPLPPPDTPVVKVAVSGLARELSFHSEE